MDWVFNVPGAIRDTHWAASKSPFSEPVDKPRRRDATELPQAIAQVTDLNRVFISMIHVDFKRAHTATLRLLGCPGRRIQHLGLQHFRRGLSQSWHDEHKRSSLLRARPLANEIVQIIWAAFNPAPGQPSH